jgi:hypothetical protein
MPSSILQYLVTGRIENALRNEVNIFVSNQQSQFMIQCYIPELHSIVVDYGLNYASASRHFLTKTMVKYIFVVIVY